jgi:hypothetical protein
MNKDLHDDMLKLVRYKVLFVKREYEHAFPEHEDLVPDNMDGSAFTAWKIAEFIQELGRGETLLPTRWQVKGYPAPEFVANGKLIGFKEDDKKYLRIFFEVLERYPRQKFKYEEQQIRVLEEIRDKLKQPQSAAKTDPYEELNSRLILSADTFHTWRENFARCSSKLSRDIANAFNEYRLIGHLKAPKITPKEVHDALHQIKGPFHRVSFDRFTGPALGDLRIYAPQPHPAPPLELAAPPLYSVWGETKENPKGRFTQKITGTNVDYVSPDDAAKLNKYLSNVAVDLTFNAYSKDLGIVSWASFFQNHSNQLRAIGYEMNGRLLWINQLLDPDMKPTVGLLEQGGFPGHDFFIIKDQFILSIDWAEKIEGKQCFCVYAMHINFDFEKCSAKFAGRILKLRNQLISK